MPGADEGGLACFEAGGLGFAMSVAHVRSVAGRAPDGPVLDLARIYALDAATRDAAHYLLVSDGEGRAVLRIDQGLAMRQRSDFRHAALPPLVAEHLVALGVEGLLHRKQRVSYLLSATRVVQLGGSA